MRFRWSRLVAAAVLALLVLGCLGPRPSSPSTSQTPTDPTMPSPAAPPTPGPMMLRTRDIPGHSFILTDHRGMTVYTNNGGRGREPVCKGRCNWVWRPVLVRAAAVSADIPGQVFKVSVSTRPEPGWRQLAVNGCRLYTFRGDRRPGEVYGEGVINVIAGKQVEWRVFVIPTNKPARTIPLTAVRGQPAAVTGRPGRCR